MSRVSIVGGGPAGLFTAYCLLEKGYQVDLYDQSTGLAKKFLIAGNGGLNLTHSEDLEIFSTRYGKDSELFKSLLNEFSPNDLREFCHGLGVETFIGTSGRVFPKKLNAAEILINWSEKLKSFPEFKLFLKHKLVNVTSDNELTFLNLEGKEIKIKSNSIVFAMGGASWKKTGSDGLWSKLIGVLEINLSEFQPMNCGFEREWSEYLKKEVDRTPLKNIVIQFSDITVRGEVMLTPFGIEGGAIYAISNYIRDEILKNGSTTISLDLKPDLEIENIIEKLNKRKKKDSLSNHLRKSLGFDKAVFILLKEVLQNSDFEDMKVLAEKIKNLKIELNHTRPIDEAISTSGGVKFDQLTEFFESKKVPGLYFAGEMLDFEAPTGGYLLQGCFSSAHRVVLGILSKS